MEEPFHEIEPNKDIGELLEDIRQNIEVERKGIDPAMTFRVDRLCPQAGQLRHNGPAAIKTPTSSPTAARGDIVDTL